MKWCAALIAGALTGALGLTAAGACGIDGVPSLSINGVLVRVNRVAPSTTAIASWAPFLGARPLAVQAPARFAENVAELRTSLYHEAFLRPWRWQFGDGATAIGDAPSHTYRARGHFKVSVAAYLPTFKQWYTFDAVEIEVR